MSHYSVIECIFTDEDALVDAIKEVEPSWEVEVHEVATNLYGYQADVRPERANIIVRRKYVGPSSNDIGFVEEGGRYRAIISEFDSSRHGHEWLGRLTQAYAKNVVLKQMRLHGWRLSGETRRENGSLKLTLEV
jgi:hypothetical protein